MITDNGKEIIGKFLLGQVPAYATHIAIGCGATPLDAGDPAPTGLESTEKLDFEMIRVPITSKGFVDDNGTTKVALTAELPTENFYNITEIGLWSAGNNSLAKTFDSKNIFTFTESWQQHETSIDPIPDLSNTVYGPSGSINDGGNKIFSVSTNNEVFRNSLRLSRKEGPRFLNSTIMMRGDSSLITGTTGNWTGGDASYDVGTIQRTSNVATLTTNGSVNHYLNVGDVITVNTGFTAFDGVHTITARTNTTVSYANTGSDFGPSSGDGVMTYSNKHIHLNGITFNIGQNSPNDVLSFAFSVIDKDAVGNNIDSVKILIEFYKNEISTTSGFAKAEITVSGAALTNSRYQVIEIPLSSLITSTDFTSDDIRLCRVFASAIATNGATTAMSTNHYIALDGLRLDNINTNNPVYKLVGYSVVRTSNGYPITKFANSSNYVEFRYNLGVA